MWKRPVLSCFGPMLNGSLLADLLRTTLLTLSSTHSYYSHPSSQRPQCLSCALIRHRACARRAVTFYQLQFAVDYDACRFPLHFFVRRFQFAPSEEVSAYETISANTALKDALYSVDRWSLDCLVLQRRPNHYSILSCAHNIHIPRSHGPHPQTPVAE